jgi:hypothetical protein
MLRPEQVLFGFQLNGVFQEGFADLSLTTRYVASMGQFLMALGLVLLIAPSMQHRIVEKGEDTVPILSAISCLALSIMLVLLGSLLLRAASFVSSRLILLLKRFKALALRRFRGLSGGRGLTAFIAMCGASEAPDTRAECLSAWRSRPEFPPA